MSGIHNKVVVGVDVGGTNIRAAIITAAGTIQKQKQVATPAVEGRWSAPERLIEAICDCVLAVTDGQAIAGVGVGCGGQFNPDTGVMRGTNLNHPDYINLPFAAPIAERLACPVYVDNDVKAAALAELRYGAGRDYQHLVCATVGTFIGGALIMDKQIVHGAGGLAGHLGQLMDFQSGMYIENFAGGVALSRRAIEQGLLASGQTTRDLFQMAADDHDAAKQLIHQTGTALGIALAGLCHVLHPEVILIGGSVGLQPFMLRAMNAGLKQHLMKNWQTIRAIPMQLGTNAGQIGAALRVYDELTSDFAL